MEDEIHRTIEKIIAQEEQNVTKLKEMRAIESTLVSLKRNLKETTMRTKKLKEEFAESTLRADCVTTELIKAQAIQSTFAAQIEASKKELKQLKHAMEQGFSKVWEQRNELCQEVQRASDQCDVWALFTKPKLIDIPKPKKQIHDNIHQLKQHEEILEKALEKRQNLISERNRLMNEPERGEEFLRINNALRYSEEMTAQLINVIKT